MDVCAASSWIDFHQRSAVVQWFVHLIAGSFMFIHVTIPVAPNRQITLLNITCKIVSSDLENPALCLLFPSPLCNVTFMK